jgi:hypothetical protein
MRAFYAMTAVSATVVSAVFLTNLVGCALLMNGHAPGIYPCNTYLLNTVVQIAALFPLGATIWMCFRKLGIIGEPARGYTRQREDFTAQQHLHNPLPPPMQI